MSSPEERVLAVPRDALARAGLQTGVTLGEASGSVVKSIFESGDFLDRSKVERNPSWLQPIPCAVVKAGASYLTLRRGEARRDSPLHGKYVIWVGGHVRVEDSSGDQEGSNFLTTSLIREIEEELSISTNEFEFLGLVVPAGSLHFAILYEATISPTLIPDVAPNGEFLTPKARKIQARFLTMPSILDLYPRLDIWSKLAVRDIYQRRTRLGFDPQLTLWRSDRR